MLKQGTPVTLRVGRFVDPGDGSPETGLTIVQADIRLSKAGGDFAQSHDAGGATHDEYGYYYLTLDAADTATCGPLQLAIVVSGALPVDQSFLVLPAEVWDALFTGENVTDSDPAHLLAQIRAIHALAGGTVQVMSNDPATPECVHRDEADAADLLTRTFSVDEDGGARITPTRP